MNAQARLGAFVLIGLLTLGLLSVRIGQINMFGGNGGATVEAVFGDVSGLDEQTPVRLAGVRVGSVASISLEGNRALVRIHLEPDIVLPASTRATLVGGGLVGEQFIALSADTDDTEPLPHGKRIPTVPSGNLDVLIAKASFIAEDIHQLTIAGKHAINTLGIILDENRGDLHKTIHNLSGISQSLNKKLPPTLDAGKGFFSEGKKSFHDLDGLLAGNRENLYRMIFEFRKTAENLAALSDDLRRNPWKLMNKQKEVPPSPRARQKKMEEMMLSTGQMGLAPARR